VPTSTGKHAGPAASAASLQMTYTMTVVELDGTWYVQSIGSSAQFPGPP
jgi:hypothetical protein